MTYQKYFSPDEWQQILSLPALTAGAVIAGDLSGLSGLMKEGRALYQEMARIQQTPEEYPLAAEIVTELMRRDSAEESVALPAPEDPWDLEENFKQLAQILNLLDQKLPAVEVQKFKFWLYEIAQATARAAKEGGLFGIGGTEVSQKEQDVLGRLREIFQITA